MSELIISPSGVRGVVGDSLNVEDALRISKLFGAWCADGMVILGLDTRLSGLMLESAVTAGLLSQGCEVVNVGVAPTPVIIHAKKKLGIKAGIIISGSHNPPEWNALKLLSSVTFTSSSEIEALKKAVPKYSEKGGVVYHEPIVDYIRDLLHFVKVRNSGLRVVVDTGAGAGKFVTPKVLEMLGCKVTLINNDLVHGRFPRNPEPVESNLRDLIKLMKTGLYDVGFAHDCDADRLALVSEDGEVYREDMLLALIAKNEGVKFDKFVTNNASSLMFEELLGKGKVVRVPVGEAFLASKMHELLKRGVKVFGGEGSCGGVMFPDFNNCRDGILAACKIVELLFNSKRKLSELVNELPVYYEERCIVKGDIKALMHGLKRKVKDFEEMDNDVKIVGSDYFVLVHPSNTEPIIRVISEAKSKEKAKALVDEFSRLLV